LKSGLGALGLLSGFTAGLLPEGLLVDGRSTIGLPEDGLPDGGRTADGFDGFLCAGLMSGVRLGL
jgi:hypothetical protein